MPNRLGHPWAPILKLYLCLKHINHSTVASFIMSLEVTTIDSLNSTYIFLQPHQKKRFSRENLGSVRHINPVFCFKHLTKTSLLGILEVSLQLDMIQLFELKKHPSKNPFFYTHFPSVKQDPEVSDQSHIG